MKVGEPETSTYEETVAKESPDLTGRGIRSYVEVLGCAFQKEVADATPHKISDKAVLMESVERAHRIRAHLFS
jgi:hypothetical protein